MAPYRDGTAEFDWMLTETMAFDPPVGDGRIDGSATGRKPPVRPEDPEPLFARDTGAPRPAPRRR